MTADIESGLGRAAAPDGRVRNAALIVLDQDSVSPAGSPAGPGNMHQTEISKSGRCSAIVRTSGSHCTRCGRVVSETGEERADVRQMHRPRVDDQIEPPRQECRSQSARVRDTAHGPFPHRRRHSSVSRRASPPGETGQRSVTKGQALHVPGRYGASGGHGASSSLSAKSTLAAAQPRMRPRTLAVWSTTGMIRP